MVVTPISKIASNTRYVGSRRRAVGAEASSNFLQARILMMVRITSYWWSKFRRVMPPGIDSAIHQEAAI